MECHRATNLSEAWKLKSVKFIVLSPVGRFQFLKIKSLDNGLVLGTVSEYRLLGFVSATYLLYQFFQSADTTINLAKFGSLKKSDFSFCDSNEAVAGLSKGEKEYIAVGEEKVSFSAIFQGRGENKNLIGIALRIRRGKKTLKKFLLPVQKITA